jgi:hypothetical protein
MTSHRSWPRRMRLVVPAAAATVALAAGTAFAATSQAGPASGGDPGAKVGVLRHQVAALRKENGRLRALAPAAVAAQLSRTRAALDKYRSVDEAKADGYAAASPCESTPSDPELSSYGGGMGIHYVNNALLKPGPLVPSKPPILVYAPSAGGGLELVAAEYFKPDADQDVKTDGDRPSLFGRAFDGPMLGHAPGMPIHFDLHVWLWKHNPSGLFAPWNPDVTC